MSAIEPPILWGSLHFMLVSGEDEAVLFHARRIREREVRLGRDSWGVSTTPGRPVLSLHGASKREMKEFDRIYKTAAPLSSPSHALHRIGNHGFDFLSEEGLSNVLPKIRQKPRGAVFFSAAVNAGPLSAAVVDAFNRIRRAARHSGCQVVVFLTRVDVSLANELLKFADELAYIDRCEPEPTAVLGFSVRWAGFRYQTDLEENRPKMISVYADAMEFREEVAEFLALELSTRVMARLRDGGRSLGCCRFRGHRPKLLELSQSLSD